MKTCYKFLIFLLLTSCMVRTSEYSQALEKVRVPFAKRICRSKKFTIGMLGGGIGGKVSIGFDGIGNLEIDEVRQLIIELEEDFIAELNAKEELTAYWESPADPHKIKIALEFSKKDNSFVDPPYIAFAFIYQNKIFYSVYDKENLTLRNVLTESYDDAYKIVYGCNRIVN